MDNFNVFYSFHYEDVGNFKANIIRNSSKLKCYKGLLTDQSIWEEFKAKTDAQIKKRIDNSKLIDSDATIILIGKNTHSRRWVKYEIIKSFEAGNTLVGIHINRIKGKEGTISRKGLNPFDRLGFKYDEENEILYFYELVDGTWQPFEDLPSIKNKKRNTVFVKSTNFWQWLRGNEKDGRFYRLSEFFREYSWKTGEHNAETLFQWIKESHDWIII
ncbi:TIR domain-containing protein [Emticicia sp. SJ17W-69]|uniref:TIR domain-containing protein n=1 Tax=Emticicia sp. SJ17W-69 TaxID=3421657 RepID=UPI003EB85C04